MNRVSLNLKDISDEAFESLTKTFKYSNTDYFKAKARNGGRAPRGVDPYYSTYEVVGNKISFARGSLSKVKSILKQYGYDVEIINKTIKKPLDEPFELHGFELRDYQEKAVSQIIPYKQCLIRGVCGSGKTEIMLDAIRRIQQHTLVIVDKKRLMKQWIKRASKRYGIKETDIGQWGDGKKVIKPLTIGIINSVKTDVDELKDRFGCVVVDECHHAPASMFNEVIDAFPAEYRIGASATMKRKDGKEFLMFDAFGKIVCEITKDILVERGLLWDVNLVIIPTNFCWEDYDSGSKKNGYTKLIEMMITDKDRYALIYKYIKYDYDNGHYGLILSDRLRSCKNLKGWLKKRNIDAKLLIGGNDKEADEALDGLEDGTVRLVIGTTIADEGLDAPRLDRAYGITPTATNPRRIIQQTGRIERPADGKSQPIFYYFWDYKMESFSRHPHSLVKLFKSVSMSDVDGNLIELNKKNMKHIYDIASGNRRS